MNERDAPRRRCQYCLALAGCGVRDDATKPPPWLSRDGKGAEAGGLREALPWADARQCGAVPVHTLGLLWREDGQLSRGCEGRSLAPAVCKAILTGWPATPVLRRERRWARKPFPNNEDPAVQPGDEAG